jgi:sarcosine oxidase/L-pipecolate oxidase
MESFKACVYARFLCVQAGVKFILGDPQGKLETLITAHNGPEREVTGIKTCDGQTHSGDLVIVAGTTLSLSRRLRSPFNNANACL